MGKNIKKRLEWHVKVDEEYKKCQDDEEYVPSCQFMSDGAQAGPAEIILQSPFRSGKYMIFYVWSKQYLNFLQSPCEVSYAFLGSKFGFINLVCFLSTKYMHFFGKYMCTYTYWTNFTDTLLLVLFIRTSKIG